MEEGNYDINDEARDDLKKRLRRCIGQLQGVIRMIEEKKPCEEVSVQLKAVRKATDACSRIVLSCALRVRFDEEGDIPYRELAKLLDF